MPRRPRRGSRRRSSPRWFPAASRPRRAAAAAACGSTRRCRWPRCRPPPRRGCRSRARVRAPGRRARAALRCAAGPPLATTWRASRRSSFGSRPTGAGVNRPIAVLETKKAARTAPPAHPVPASTAMPIAQAATAPGPVRLRTAQASSASAPAASAATGRATGVSPAPSRGRAAARCGARSSLGQPERRARSSSIARKLCSNRAWPRQGRQCSRWARISSASSGVSSCLR